MKESDVEVQQSRRTSVRMTSRTVQTTYNSTLCQNWDKDPITTQLLDYYAEQVKIFNYNFLKNQFNNK